MSDRPAPVLHRADPGVTIWHGHSLDVLRAMPSESVHAVVCDPPYGLSNTDTRHVLDTITRWIGGDREFVPDTGGGFMGNRWDDFVPPPAIWDECLRVLKPGGHMIAFAGSRTYDLMGLSIRLAGFEIRDGLAWLYGSGFPKSHDVAKAIDKGAGHWRGRAGAVTSENPSMTGANYERTDKGDPVTAAAAWDGWGTALKPAFEPMVLARKPLQGSVAANVLAHGTGALNIDANRIHTEGSEAKAYSVKRLKPGATLNREGGNWRPEGDGATRFEGETKAGRFPANVLLDESQAAELDRQAPATGAGGRASGPSLTDATDATDAYGARNGLDRDAVFYGDAGGASRFFYVAKAPTNERPTYLDEDGKRHAHATVKPLDLIRWIIRLITPPGGTVVDPFLGSGTTAEAAVIEGFDFIGSELEAKYLPLIDTRLDRGDPTSALKGTLTAGTPKADHGRLF